jgi:hypothetical protein
MVYGQALNRPHAGLSQAPCLQQEDVPIPGDANRLMRGCIPGSRSTHRSWPPYRLLFRFLGEPSSHTPRWQCEDSLGCFGNDGRILPRPRRRCTFRLPLASHRASFPSELLILGRVWTFVKWASSALKDTAFPRKAELHVPEIDGIVGLVAVLFAAYLAYYVLRKAGVIGDTLGDPFRDTAGPSLHVLIKLLSTVTLVLASLYYFLHPWCEIMQEGRRPPAPPVFPRQAIARIPPVC